jgi:2-octaprenyl-6-methoxyphenol hydroxylase
MQYRTLPCEIAIVGAGMVGLVLAAALGRRNLSVALIDGKSFDALKDRARDGRTSAIAAGSRAVLRRAGAWDAIAAKAEPIQEIRVSDSDAPLFLHYDHALLDEGPLGWIAENADIRDALIAEVRACDSIVTLDGRNVDSLARAMNSVEALLSDGTRVRAVLAIAADGQNSPLRQAAEIESISWRYDQASIVCTVTHEHPHRGIAHEKFLPAGPFAILPMTGNRSSIVWTERAELVPEIVKLPRAEFTAALARRFGDFLGRLEVEGEIFAHPLALSHARHYTAQRLALIGDAAHTIHPIAGQGFNLGLRDVAALEAALDEALALGLDLGGRSVLDAYEHARRFDNSLMIALTDGLNRLFSNTVAPVKLARDVGLAAVNFTPPLKRLFMRHAMGLRD